MNHGNYISQAYVYHIPISVFQFAFFHSLYLCYILFSKDYNKTGLAIIIFSIRFAPIFIFIHHNGSKIT